MFSVLIFFVACQVQGQAIATKTGPIKIDSCVKYENNKVFKDTSADPNVFGLVEYKKGRELFNVTDTCKSEKVVFESVCDNNKKVVSFKTINCEFGCQYGTCKPAPAEKLKEVPVSENVPPQEEKPVEITSSSLELCDDNTDNDGNGLTDCFDTLACSKKAVCMNKCVDSDNTLVDLPFFSDQKKDSALLDSDPSSIFVKGNVSLQNYNDNGEWISGGIVAYDSCLGSNILNESRCSGSQVNPPKATYMLLTCANGCTEGVCNK